MNNNIDNFTNAFDYTGEEQDTVEATPVPIHIAHVDLAPMKQSLTGRNNLAALDPSLRIGGREFDADAKAEREPRWDDPDAYEEKLGLAALRKVQVQRTLYGPD